MSITDLNPAARFVILLGIILLAGCSSEPKPQAQSDSPAQQKALASISSSHNSGTRSALAGIGFDSASVENPEALKQAAQMMVLFQTSPQTIDYFKFQQQLQEPSSEKREHDSRDE